MQMYEILMKAVVSLPQKLALITIFLVAAKALSEVTEISRQINGMVKNKGMIPKIEKTNKQIIFRILSARGSKNLPKLDTSFSFLAKYPSKKSDVTEIIYKTPQTIHRIKK